MTNATTTEAPLTESAPEGKTRTALEEGLEWLANLTPEDRLRIRQRLDAKSRPPRPILEGKTLADMVEGTWPGDETDEEVAEALVRLS